VRASFGSCWRIRCEDVRSKVGVLEIATAIFAAVPFNRSGTLSARSETDATEVTYAFRARWAGSGVLSSGTWKGAKGFFW
jgi:hypothetical protein